MQMFPLNCFLSSFTLTYIGLEGTLDPGMDGLLIDSLYKKWPVRIKLYIVLLNGSTLHGPILQA